MPIPPLGVTTGKGTDDSQDDVTPPSSLMEHPPLAVFVNGKLIRFNFCFSPCKLCGSRYNCLPLFAMLFLTAKWPAIYALYA